MNSSSVLSILSSINPEYPEKEYFQIHGMESDDRLVLLDYFINTKQFEDKIIISIHKQLKEKGIENLSFKQVRYISNKIEETFNQHFSSMYSLYNYPTLSEINNLKGKIWHKKTLT